MSDELRSALLCTIGLDLAAAVALVLTLTRGAIARDPARLRPLLRLSAIVLALQAVHFAEELSTGFQVRFPELLGLTPVSTRLFASFNLFWLALWSVSIVGLAHARRWALFPLWFLAIASAVNGVAHPLFSLATGGYFPGLFTSPLVGIGGVLLLRRLGELTR